jgi:hypothetical protein
MSKTASNITNQRYLAPAAPRAASLAAEPDSSKRAFLRAALTTEANAILNNDYTAITDPLSEVVDQLASARARKDQTEEELAAAGSTNPKLSADLQQALTRVDSDIEDLTKQRAQLATAASAVLTHFLHVVAGEQLAIERGLSAGNAALAGIDETKMAELELEIDQPAESKDEQLQLKADLSPIKEEIMKIFRDNPQAATNELISILDDNLNGSELASDAEVSAGYIPEKHHFHYFLKTIGTFTVDPGEAGTKLTPTDAGGRIPGSFIENLALNCHMLREGKALTVPMFLLAYIKTVIAYSGVFQPSTRSRCVFIDEYTAHTRRPDGFMETVTQMAAIKQKPAVMEQEAAIKRNVHRIIGTAVHVFRTRNHHYQDSAAQFVQRTWSAVWNGSPPEWDISEEDLFRSSIHCFGMVPLVNYCMRAFSANVMPAALVIRKTAARAGTAPVRLVDAAFKCMQAEPFYPMVAAAFATHILNVNNHVQQLIAWGDDAHVNHWFMCGARARATYNEALAEPLMPLAMAYIRSLGPRSTLKMQVALNKRVSNHAALVEAFGTKFADFRTNVFETSDLEALLYRYREAITGEAAPAVASATGTRTAVGGVPVAAAAASGL